MRNLANQNRFPEGALIRPCLQKAWRFQEGLWYKNCARFFKHLVSNTYEQRLTRGSYLIPVPVGKFQAFRYPDPGPEDHGLEIKRL